MSSGVESIDALLGGGWLKAAVNTIYGGPGTGKTSVIIETILADFKQFPKNKKRVYLVCDTERSWSKKRLAKLVAHAGFNLDEVLDRVIITQAPSFKMQHEIVMKAWNEYSKKLKPALFVVDSFISFYHQQLGNTAIEQMAGTARQLLGKLATEMVHIYQYAMKHECPIILVSWNSSPVGDAFEEIGKEKSFKAMEKGEAVKLEDLIHGRKLDMIGGRRLQYMSKAIVKLIKTNSPLRYAVLKKSLFRPEDIVTSFEIQDHGIVGNNPKIWTTEELKQKLLKEHLKEKEEEGEESG